MSSYLTRTWTNNHIHMYMCLYLFVLKRIVARDFSISQPHIYDRFIPTLFSNLRRCLNVKVIPWVWYFPESYQEGCKTRKDLIPRGVTPRMIPGWIRFRKVWYLAKTSLDGTNFRFDLNLLIWKNKQTSYFKEIDWKHPENLNVQ
jgi:hypothetical protein